MKNMLKLFIIIWLLVLIFITYSLTSCNKKSYPKRTTQKSKYFYKFQH